MTPERRRLIIQAAAASERARQYLAKHHADRSWAEVIRDLRVTVEQCVTELERDR